MANIMDEFHLYGAEDNCSSFNGEGFNGKVENWGKAQLYGADECGEVDTFWSDSWFYQQEYPFPGDKNFNDFSFGVTSPTIQLSEKEIEKLMKVSAEESLGHAPRQDHSRPSSLASIELPSNHDSSCKQFTGQNQKDSNRENEKEVGCRRLSTEGILRMAGARFIQSSEKIDDLPMVGQPYFPSFSNLSDKEKEEIDLAQNLLASAEKVANQRFDSWSKLLRWCNHPSFKQGTTVERVVYYFAEALQEKIERETGNLSLCNKLKENDPIDIDDAMMIPNSTALAYQQGIPFAQVAQFAGIQAILENVANEKQIHIIDFEIRSGVHWTALMQALAARHECPVQLLKITAIGTGPKLKIEKTCDRLMSFAKTEKLPFSFKIVMVQDMLELDDGLLEVESDEAIVVYLPFILRTMLRMPNRIESLMKVVKTINASLMVINEIEGSHNSQNFVNRFIEAVFFFGAYFECVEACLGRNHMERRNIESMYFSQAIRNIVASEEDHRKIRHVSINIWRAFFARFRMEEIELSAASLCQARLVIKKFACGDSCTLDMNGKCLILGWKGTPLHSLSVWKFH